MLKARIHYRSGKTQDLHIQDYDNSQFRDWVTQQIFNSQRQKVDFVLFDDCLIAVPEI